MKAILYYENAVRGMKWWPAYEADLYGRVARVLK